ncbi:MAG TPA: GapR family DNA-binding domain-containing protein [Stellaceae bacterium]|nr:GapR family DNA-binding domain-containing protein [Stellaceae bacterium]
MELGKLKGLVSRIEAKKSELDDARSDLGNVYQEAEDLGFNRRALREAVRLKGMEREKRNDYLASLAAYCDALGVFAQKDLLGDAPGLPAPPAARRPRSKPRKDGEAATLQ